MGLDILQKRGVPLERQIFSWRDLVRIPISKLNDDAFTPVRIVRMNGIETEATRFSHACLSVVLPEPLAYKSNRGFVRQVLSQEANLRARGPQFVPKEMESELSLASADASTREER